VSLIAGLLTVVALVDLSRRIFPSVPATLVGWLAACQPYLVRASADIMSDSLYLLLFVAALWSAARAATEKRFLAYAVTGGLIGFAYLTRPEALVLGPAVAIYWWIVADVGSRRRVFFGTGTGNTAMRTMGQAPTRVRDFGEYLRVVRGLLHGEEVEYTLNGVTHPIRFQNLDQGYINIEDPIPIMVGGFGPRAQALAGQYGDGLITGIPRGGAIPQALANVKKGADKAGRAMDGFQTYALVNLLMLEKGETLKSERVIAECGSAIMANVHYLVDFVKETGSEPPDYAKPIWDEYMDFHMSRDEATRHQKLHESHYSFLDPDEARFITPEIIRNFCIAGHPEEIVEQLRGLEKQGLDAVTFSLPLDKMYRTIEDFSRKVISKM